MHQTIKVLAFDQGGIYIGVDYEKTVEAFVDIFHNVAQQLQKQFPDKNILPNNILFIDDSKKHIDGRSVSEDAINAGWQRLLVPSNSPAEMFRSVVINRLKT